MNKTNATHNGTAEPTLLQNYESDLFSREQAAAYLGIAVQTLAMWKWAKRYDLPFVKIGRLIKYRRSDLDAFIHRHSSGQSLSVI
jgi:excisionase family DNA binding protein